MADRMAQRYRVKRMAGVLPRNKSHNRRSSMDQQVFKEADPLLDHYRVSRKVREIFKLMDEVKSGKYRPVRRFEGSRPLKGWSDMHKRKGPAKPPPPKPIKDPNAPQKKKKKRSAQYIERRKAKAVMKKQQKKEEKERLRAQREQAYQRNGKRKMSNKNEEEEEFDEERFIASINKQQTAQKNSKTKSEKGKKIDGHQEVKGQNKAPQLTKKKGDNTPKKKKKKNSAKAKELAPPEKRRGFVAEMMNQVAQRSKQIVIDEYVRLENVSAEPDARVGQEVKLQTWKKKPKLKAEDYEQPSKKKKTGEEGKAEEGKKKKSEDDKKEDAPSDFEHEDIPFGEVASAPPKLTVVPKMDPSLFPDRKTYDYTVQKLANRQPLLSDRTTNGFEQIRDRVMNLYRKHKGSLAGGSGRTKQLFRADI